MGDEIRHTEDGRWEMGDEMANGIAKRKVRLGTDAPPQSLQLQPWPVCRPNSQAGKQE